MITRRAGQQCEACGAGEDRTVQRWLEAHERLSYDERTGVQAPGVRAGHAERIDVIPSSATLVIRKRGEVSAAMCSFRAADATARQSGRGARGRPGAPRPPATGIVVAVNELAPAVFRHVDQLPEHRRVLSAVLEFFRPQAVAGFVAGSVAAGGTDQESDLDVGICFADADARDRVWARRWDWPIAPWFLRFDADHVKPYFVVYFFNPRVKVDIPLYTLDDLPSGEGGPYVVGWDDTGHVAQWAADAVPVVAPVDWSGAVHEEERFWAWLVYSVQHVRRGEYYSIAGDFWCLRDVVEQWQARLAGRHRFVIRRAEQLVDTSELAQLFPRPERGELKQALSTMIELHERQRAQLDLPWRTSDQARTSVTQWVQDL